MERNSCDSRYCCILDPLDIIIESVRREPGMDVRPNLDRLLEIMTEHIGNENAYMEMVGFPLAVHHCLHHQFIRAKTVELRRRTGEDRETLPGELCCVRQLWVEHIQIYDRIFEKFLAE